MSARSSPSPPRSHRAMRAQLRKATFIDAQTGVKSKRSFTLHSPPSNNDGTDERGFADDTTPLLRTPRSPDDDYTSSRAGNVLRAVIAYFRKFLSFAVSDLGKSVLKCALAYVLGSLCTFIPQLAYLFGRNLDSKHTIATITVYFHPARTMGSMLEALLCAAGAFLYTAAVSLSSMGVSVLFADHLHQIVIGHIIVLVVFVGGGLGMVGYIKLKSGDALVSISCSLMSLALISVLTSEGAVQAGDLSFRKIGQYLKMIVAGVIASGAVSFLVFPVSATTKLKKNMVKTNDTLSDMLGLITSSFISGNEAELEDQEYVLTSEQHRKSIATLNQNLRESKVELNILGLEKEAHIHAQMVDCVKQLSQSIGGLRSAAAMQFVIITMPLPLANSQIANGRASYTSILTSPAKTPMLERNNETEYDFGNLLQTIQDSPDTPNSFSSVQRRHSKFRSPREIFELFIEQLGPSMKSLAFTMKEILDDLPFDPGSSYSVENNPKFRSSLERALNLYKEARSTALTQVYNRKDLDRDRPIEVAADWEEAAACCGHFSFSLLEVAEQVQEYLDILDMLAFEVDERPNGRSWSWLKFWRIGRRKNSWADDAPKYKADRDDANDLDIRALKIKKPVHVPSERPEKGRDALKRRVLRKLYDAFSFLRKDDKRFAVKVGFGAMLYALPSYLTYTRPIYTHWRGEWGLLSYMLVCSMTIGASNTTGLQRFLGTCLGAGLAIAAWQISNSQPIPLIIFGFCMAYWTAYIIVGMGKGPLGRFIMLTYNLSALYAYTLTMAGQLGDDDEEDDNNNPKILTIALHRVVAVLTGCIWGLIITRLVWPISARRKVKDALSLLWLRMGLVWKRDPLAVFTHGESQHQYMNLRQETELQLFLARIQKLVDASKHEFSMRRPFPTLVYSRILKSTARMLEVFHAMNVVIMKDINASNGEIALLEATAREREHLCSRISHQFSVLASSMKLEYSIATDALPNTEPARDRLLSKIFSFRKADLDKHDATDEDYSLLYTYALVTGQIGVELQRCLKEVESLFGVLDEESLWLQ